MSNINHRNQYSFPFDLDSSLSNELKRYWNNLTDSEKQMSLNIETLYSLDPQKVATETAKQIESEHIIDAFCGAGGASIAFARSGKDVIAIERNPQKLEMAKHNSELFGVKQKIDFILGDSMKLLPNMKAEAIYLDPEWGGIDYKRQSTFKLNNFSPNGAILLELAFGISKKVILKAPRNFDFNEIDNLTSIYSVQENYLNNQFLYYTIFFKT